MFGTVLFFCLVSFIIFWNLAWATLITPNLQNSLTSSSNTHSRLLLADPKKGVCWCVSVCATKQTGLAICPRRVLWFPCVIQTNVRLWAGDELWQTAPDIFASQPTTVVLADTFSHSEQREGLKVPRIHFSDTVKGIFYTLREHKHTSWILCRWQSVSQNWGTKKWLLKYEPEDVILL